MDLLMKYALGRIAAVVLVCAAMSPPVVAQGDGKREITATGCLLSSGYAGFQIEDAKLDAIDGKAVSAEAAAKGPKKWVLEGGGNLRPRTGEKVQVVGRSDWRAEDESPATPRLDVKSVTTVAPSCT
jgi:hypothetical protein